MLINARSLKCKLAEFNALLVSGDHDIVCVAETWLNDTVTDAMLTNGSSYDVVRLDRLSRGGGIAVFIRSGIAFDPPCFSTNVEGLYLDFARARFRLVLGYLPDGKSPLEILNRCTFS